MSSAEDNSVSEAAVTLAGSIDKFASILFKEISHSTKEDNLIYSPFALNIVLAMLSYGAANLTRQEMRDALHFNNATDDVIQAGYKNLIELLNDAKGVQMDIAYKIFTKVPIKQSYLDLTSDIFHSTPQQINFSDAVPAAETINKWSEDDTKGRIKDILRSDVFSDDTSLVLANAVNFKSQFRNPFNSRFVKDLPFYSDKQNFKNVTMMTKEARFVFGHSDELKADFINLRYNNYDFSMVIILLYEFEGLTHVQEHLNMVNLSDLVENADYKRGVKLEDPGEYGYTREVNLQIPKFKIESTMDLKSAIINSGMKNMFERSAEFSGLSDSEMRVDKVLQKAFIEVNEEDSEVDESTKRWMIMRCPMEPGSPTPFFVNRPFCFAILHHPTKTNLFMGTVKMPNYT